MKEWVCSCGEATASKRIKVLAKYQDKKGIE